MNPILLEYNDSTLDTYYQIKKIFNKPISFQIKAFGFPEDNRKAKIIKLLDLTKTKKLNKDDFSTTIPDVASITLNEIIPLGLKINYLNWKKIFELDTEFPLRKLINQSIYPIFPDDEIHIEVFFKDKKCFDSISLAQDVLIELDTIKHNYNVHKNDTMSVSIKIVHNGLIREQLENVSCLKNKESTNEYIKIITSQQFIINKLSSLQDNMSLINDRLQLFGLKNQITDFENLKNILPLSHDFDFFQVCDIEGFVFKLGLNVSNQNIEETDYQSIIAEHSKMIDFFNEKNKLN